MSKIKFFQFIYTHVNCKSYLLFWRKDIQSLLSLGPWTSLSFLNIEYRLFNYKTYKTVYTQQARKQVLIQRRGATLCLCQIATDVGDALCERVPQLWEAMTGALEKTSENGKQGGHTKNRALKRLGIMMDGQWTAANGGNKTGFD